MARTIAAEVEDDVAERIDAIAHVDDTDSRQVVAAALRLYALLPKEARASLRYVESGDPQLIRTAARRIARSFRLCRAAHSEVGVWTCVWTREPKTVRFQAGSALPLGGEAHEQAEARMEKQMVEARLAQLRDEVAEGLEQARRGELLDGREVRERILAKSTNRRHRSDEE